MNDMIGLFRFSYFALILLVAAAWDIRFKRIPNWLTFPSMIVALSFYVIAGGFQGLLFSQQGAVVGMAILIIPYLMRGMGAGDVKLIGVVGAFLGAGKVVLALLWTALVGGLYAIILMIYYVSLKRTLRPHLSAVCSCQGSGEISPPSNAMVKKPSLCYGVAIAIGTMLSLTVRIPLLPNL
jgi:prepilin peptidase CpaA